MIEKLNVKIKKPQYVTTTGVTFAQVDSWFGHCRRDLKLDITYPFDMEKNTYPCVVWICGGAWLQMDKSAHLYHLNKLAEAGFVVASVEYRTSNEGPFPIQLQDVKAAIRYLRAHAARYNIDANHIGVMGESAGGYLTCMSALDAEPLNEVGAYLDYSSAVQAACPWYPPTNLATFPYESEVVSASSPESLLLGFGAWANRDKAYQNSPVSKVTKDAPPFLIIHGNKDMMVPYTQSVELYEKLEAAECDVKLLTLEGANHADVHFYQDEVWDRIIDFFKEKLK